MDKHEWLLKRNCSLSPRQLAIAYAVLVLISFAVALPFTLLGAWHVFAYATLEMAVVALAFLHYARHATDHEHVALTDGALLVERVLAGRTQQVRLDPSWTRIAVSSGAQRLVGLEAHGIKVEVGRFATEARRRQFAYELRRALQGAAHALAATRTPATG